MGLFPGKELADKVRVIRGLGNGMKAVETGAENERRLPVRVLLLLMVAAIALMVPVVRNAWNSIGKPKSTGAPVNIGLRPGAAVAGGSPPSSKTAVYYSPESNLEVIDGRVLNSAKQRIDVAASSLTDKALCALLAAKAEQKVVVRIYRESSEMSEANDCTTQLLAATAEIRVKAPGEKMRMEAYLVDGRYLRSGSASLSLSGEQREDNDVVLTSDGPAIGRFSEVFGVMWNREDNRILAPNR